MVKRLLKDIICFMQPQTNLLEVKLNNHGRYTWKIILEFDLKKASDTVKEIKRIDNELRDEFPAHVTQVSSKVVGFDDE